VGGGPAPPFNSFSFLFLFPFHSKSTELRVFSSCPAALRYTRSSVDLFSFSRFSIIDFFFLNRGRPPPTGVRPRPTVDRFAPQSQSTALPHSRPLRPLTALRLGQDVALVLALVLALEKTHFYEKTDFSFYEKTDFSFYTRKGGKGQRKSPQLEGAAQKPPTIGGAQLL